MARVYLEGSISKFGTEFPVKEGMSVANIFKLISAQVEGFRNHIIEAAENGIEFTIQHGKDFLGEEDLLLNLAKDDIIITELPVGANGGVGKILAAIAIVTAAVFAAPLLTGGTSFFGAGGVLAGGAGATAQVTGLTALGLATNLAITGLTELIAPGPEVDSAESNQAALFNGPVNTAQQGIPVPVAYGELIVGGSPISFSFQSSPFPTSSGYFFPRIGDIDGSNTSYDGQNVPNISYGTPSNPFIRIDIETLTELLRGSL